MTPLDVERLRPWAPAIREACGLWNEDPYLLAAICLRESGAGWGAGYEPKGAPDGWGDGGWAFGLWQVDRRWHGEDTQDPDAGYPRFQAECACRILHQSREYLRHHQALDLEPLDLTVAAVAAYNAGPTTVRKALVAGHHADICTTGRNYSQDVLARRDALRQLAPDLFSAAPAAP